MGGKISTVTHALVRATLEVPVLVEDDLKKIRVILSLFYFYIYTIKFMSIKFKEFFC